MGSSLAVVVVDSDVDDPGAGRRSPEPHPEPRRRLAEGRRHAPLDALVLDATTRQSLVSTRSLGRRGLTVGLAEGRGSLASCGGAPAIRSRWAAEYSILPAFEDDPQAYASAVLELVQDHHTASVIPCSDQSVASLRPIRAEIERHCGLALADERALALAVDKAETLRVAQVIGIPVPGTIEVARSSDLPAAVAALAYPAVIKPTHSWSEELAGERVLARPVTNGAEAADALSALLEAGMTALVQPWLSGRREAVSIFRVKGKVVAAFAQFAHRTSPVLGGASVVRESIPLERDIFEAAVAIVDALGLDGYTEVEFRRDGQGRALLMELNPRLSGSVEVAVRSGVDFPLMMWQWSTGRPVDIVRTYRVGVRMRWLTGDLRWLRESLRPSPQPDRLPPWRALATFAGDFLRPQWYDFVDRRDLAPLGAEVGRVVRKRLRPGPRPPRPGRGTRGRPGRPGDRRRTP